MSIRKKYPFVRQEDYKDCGAASLLMIIKYYHGNIPYESLKEELDVTKQGIRAGKIITIAKKYGFDAKGIEGNFEQLKEEVILLPCIAHIILNQSYYHYVVIFEMNMKKEYMMIGDPAKGIQKISFQEFETIWNHVILTFYPKTPIPYIESTSILKKQFLEILKKEKQPFLCMIGLSLLITLSSITFSFLLEHFVSMLDHHNEYLYLYGSTLFFIILIIIKNGSHFFRNYLFFHIYQRIDFTFMNLIFDQILSLPYRYYKNKTTGEMIARIEDIGVIRSFLSTLMLSSLMDLPLFLITGIVLYFINSKLFIISFISLLFYMILFFLSQKRIFKKVEQVEEENAHVISYMVEVIGGYESVFGSHLKTTMKNKFYDQYFHYTQNIKQLEQAQNHLQTWNQNLFDGSMVSLLAFGIFLVAKEQTTIASLLLFHSLFLYFIDPIRNLLKLGEEWKKVTVSWKRLSNLFQEQKELGIYEKNVCGSIEFKNVTFSYNHQPILKNINFHISNGDKVLMVGKSGTGKSTILKLLMKYYAVSRNSIYIDHTDIVDYKKESLNQILYVSMKEQLFTGPLYQNILLGKQPDSSYEAIIQLTEVSEIISKTPLGHHLVLEENGANLSGGEKQRVVLARSLLLPFQILLLDEATSQMDPNMERRILKRLFQKYSDKTIIMVSHRMDNVDLFDQLLEISDGHLKRNEVKNGRKNLERPVLDHV